MSLYELLKFLHVLAAAIWVGGAVLLLGTLVALWPAPQPAPRAARVPARAEPGAVGVAA